MNNKQVPTEQGILDWMTFMVPRYSGQNMQRLLEWLFKFTTSDINMRVFYHEVMQLSTKFPMKGQIIHAKALLAEGVIHNIFDFDGIHDRYRFPVRSRKVFWTQMMEKKVCQHLSIENSIQVWPIIIDGETINLTSDIPYYPPLPRGWRTKDDVQATV